MRHINVLRFDIAIIGSLVFNGEVQIAGRLLNENEINYLDIEKEHLCISFCLEIFNLVHSRNPVLIHSPSYLQPILFYTVRPYSNCKIDNYFGKFKYDY